MDTSACPRVCVPHTVFQKVSAQDVKSSVGLGPQLGLGTLHLQVQRLHVLGGFKHARIEILLGQRLVIGQFLEELHVVDGCQILLTGIVVATQSLAAISQLGSMLQDLQSITRQALKGFAGTIKQLIDVAWKLLLGILGHVLYNSKLESGKLLHLLYRGEQRSNIY